MLETCQIAVSKPNRNRLWRLRSARKQLRMPTETVRGAAGGGMAKQRNAVESCREGFEAFKAFKGC